jgi:tRNA (mo5U34)-methyltransferase
VTGPDPGSLRAAVAEHEWYHSIEVAPGVVTPGWFDTRRVVAQLAFPASLAGQRCLDVGTFDGFWAFEMEDRGAAEVVAVDVLDPAAWDWPAGSDEAVVEAIGRRKAGGSGFELVHQARRSGVVRHERSVYDLDPVEVGTFDFVYVGSLLLHLRDPVGALERAAAVCRGQVLVVDAIDLPLSMLLRHRPVAGLDGRGRPWWWKPNTAGLARMVEAAGLAIVSGPTRVYLPAGAGQPTPRPSLRSVVTRAGLDAAVLWRRGDPHAAILARPR